MSNISCHCFETTCHLCCFSLPELHIISNLKKRRMLRFRLWCYRTNVTFLFHEAGSWIGWVQRDRVGSWWNDGYWLTSYFKLFMLKRKKPSFRRKSILYELLDQDREVTHMRNWVMEDKLNYTCSLCWSSMRDLLCN